MSVILTLSGTVVSISAGVPATYNQAGFVALSFTEIGQITAPPSGGGRQYEDVSYTLLKDRATVHLKGTYDEEPTTFELVTAIADAGQVLLKAAHLSDAFYSFKVVYPDGDTDYFQALVFNVVNNASEANNVRRKAITIRKHSQGTVEVAGAGATTYTLTYNAGENGSILGTSPQTVSIGHDGDPVAAVAATSFVFEKWSDESTENPRIDKYVQGDVTVTASFVSA